MKIGGFDPERLTRIKNLPSLSAASTLRLAERIERERSRILSLKPGACTHTLGARVTHKTRALRKAEHLLAMANLRLVVWVCGPYRDSGLGQEDLIQEGFLGLLRAIDMFCPRAGFKFSTYAVFWIRRYVLRALQEKSRLIRVPTRGLGELVRLTAVSHELTQLYGRPATLEQIAGAARMPVRKALRLLHGSRRPVSLFAHVGEDGELVDQLPVPTPEAPFHPDLRPVLSDLPERERRVLDLRFGLNGLREHSLREVGEIFGVTTERIRQIQQRALRRLREALPTRDAVLQRLADIAD